MKPPTERQLDIAVRAYPLGTPPRGERRDPGPPSGIVVVLDCETRTDMTQRLLFGSYRVHAATGRLVEEGLIAADDLSDDERTILEMYRAGVIHSGRRLRLVSRAEFAERILWRTVYKTRATLVGFNLFFDLSRLAVGWRPARGSVFEGGVTLRFWEGGIGRHGTWRPHQYRPELRVRTLDSRRPLIQFTKPPRLDPDLREGDGYAFPGHFVDLRAGSYAFSDRGHTLESACRAFGVERPKTAYRGEHGVLTPDYVDYNREDVRATYDLFRAVSDEHARHPIDLPLSQTLSPAAVGKGYLRAMGIRPALDKNPGFPADRLGHATSAYYGGRAECRIRLAEVPVTYLDVASMYPTVFALGDLWPVVIAKQLRVVDATSDARELLKIATRDTLLEPAVWPSVGMVFCRIRPAGELLPVRAEYASTGWQIGLNHLDSAPRELWFTLADLIANQLLGGPQPDVAEAFRVVPEGMQVGLRATALRGAIELDPRRNDFFVQLVQERQRAASDPSLPMAERDALRASLKTNANAAAYGIWAEMREEARQAGGVEVEVAGLDTFRCRVPHAERVGEYCFTPLAATVTGLARLMLALLQSEVEVRGGTHLACDTDSLIVVASARREVLRLPGGHQVQALSWAEVDEVRERLNRLNPYDRTLVSTIVKLEDENFARRSDGSVDQLRRIPLLGVAISAKRFVLYERDGEQAIIRKRSEHGLGALLAPTDDGSDWIGEVWRRVIAEARGMPARPVPAWHRLPALSRVSATNAHVLRAFGELNAALPYGDQVKPANFLLLAHDDPLVALPPGLDRGRLTLIAPYASSPADWMSLPYRNRFDGGPVPITTAPGGRAGAVRIKTFGDVVDEYVRHPETKSSDPDGGQCTRTSTGLLGRVRIHAARVRPIGKESHRLEDVEAGQLRTTEDPVREYVDIRGEWEAALPRLRELRGEHGTRFLMKASGLSERAVRDALNRGRIPHPMARDTLLRLARKAT